MSENCVFMFSIVSCLAFASDDRAAAVVALCECQASRAFREVYLLVSKAARCRDSGNCESESICRESCVQYCVTPGLALSQASLCILFTSQDFSCLPCFVHHLLFFLPLCPLSQCTGSLWASELCNKEFHCVRLLLKLTASPCPVI